MTMMKDKESTIILKTAVVHLKLQKEAPAMKKIKNMNGHDDSKTLIGIQNNN
jgi:hypothetical protein